MQNKKEVMFNTFQDVKSPAHRAWNQLNFTRNLQLNHGDDVAGDYVKSLSEPEQFNITILMGRLKAKGEEFVRKELSNIPQ